jgi:hypothetical protein
MYQPHPSYPEVSVFDQPHFSFVLPAFWKVVLQYLYWSHEPGRGGSDTRYPPKK